MTFVQGGMGLCVLWYVWYDGVLGCDVRCDGADGLAGLSLDALLAVVPGGCS